MSKSVKMLRRKKQTWTKEAVGIFLQIWPRYSQQLRGNVKNHIICAYMAQELSKRNVVVTAQDVRVKMNNMTQKYREEKKKITTGSVPSEWPYYEEVHKIIGAYRCNSSVAEDSLQCDTLLLSPTTSSFHTSEIFNFDENTFVPHCDENTFVPHFGETRTSTPLSGPEESSSCSVAAASPTPGTSSTATSEKGNKNMRFQGEILKEIKTSNEHFLKEMAASRRVSEEMLKLEERYINASLKFQNDFLQYLKDNKK